MNQPHIFVDMKEASAIVINFIGSERFNEVVQSIDNNARAGFMAGLSFALCLAMAESKTYLTHANEQETET
jgi:hypothetical protein